MNIPQFVTTDFSSTAFQKSVDNSTGLYHFLFPEENEGVVNLRVVEKAWNLETFQCSSRIDSLLVSEIEKLHGIDPKQQFLHILQEEDKISLDRSLKEKYYSLGKNSRLDILSKWKKFLWKKFKIEPIDYVVDYRKFLVKLFLYSNLITTRSRSGNTTFCLVSPKIASLIGDFPGFVFLQHKEIVSPGSIYAIGNLNGIGFYVDPTEAWNNETILMGKVTREGEGGVILLQKDRILQTTQVDEFSEIMSLMSRRAVISVGDAEKRFLEIQIKIGKKPLWKKIIGA